MQSITLHDGVNYQVRRGSTGMRQVCCPACNATQAHTLRGDLNDVSVPVTLTCVNGHDVPLPWQIDPRQLLFTASMRAD